MKLLSKLSTAPVVAALSISLFAQTSPAPLDPARDLAPSALESATHKPLLEQFIWTANGSAHSDNIDYSAPKLNEHTEPHFFRAHFRTGTRPAAATLYLAGPRSVRVYVNGDLVDSATIDLNGALGSVVYTSRVESHLRPGDNVLAVEAVRGKNINSFVNSAATAQITRGEALLAKLLPAVEGVDAEPLLLSDTQWKSSASSAPGWEKPGFNDSTWAAVETLGGAENNIDFLQWNADAGLYRWPGYNGISPFLAHVTLSPKAVLHSYEARSHFSNVASLTAPASGSAQPFTVALDSPQPRAGEMPSLTLDFGKELNGRVVFTSTSDAPAELTLQMGESLEEAEHQPYLGVLPLRVPAHGVARGPKSAFRYVKLVFTGGASPLRFASINVDGIFYPVRYRGSFRSSDPELNRIWEIGAYTSHLCMQDDIWDAPKRDRGRWMGDLDVSGRVISSVFADTKLMEDTMDRLLGPAPIHQHVNGIPGYSAFWVTGQAEFYRHLGDRAYLERQHDGLVQLLSYMEAELDGDHIFHARPGEWPFVDWSYQLEQGGRETTRATHFEFFFALREGAWLLRELGDTEHAAHFEQTAEAMQAAATAHLLDPHGSFGDRWQTNSMAVVSGIASPAQRNAVWNSVLAGVGKTLPYPTIISPYYGFYVLTAMAETGHRKEALDWMHQFWGGMVREGATSFWEGYDPSWYKDNFHASLQADDGSGYYVSLAHGWSSGPTAWLMDQILGIRPTGAGFRTVRIRPDLAGLEWAEGSEPTPRGPITLRIDSTGTTLDLPPDTEAEVDVLLAPGQQSVRVNGSAATSTSVENGTRARLTLKSSGHYVLAAN